jgi:hypothetical protein
VADARELIGWLDDLLDPVAYEDIGPNRALGTADSRCRRALR